MLGNILIIGLILAMAAIFIVFIIYNKNRDTVEQKAGERLSSIRAWTQDNPALTKILITLGLFIVSVGFARFVDDFGHFNSRELEMVSGHVGIIIAARLISLALFSILNVYFIPSLVKRMGNNNGGFWAILIGFFGLILCGPLLIIWSGLGLGTSLFTQFTGMHMIFQSQRN